MYRNTLEAMRNRAAGIDSPRSVYKNFSIKELDALKRKVRAVPGYKDNFSRQIEDLVSEAYKGQDKKLNRALKKIGKYKKLNSELQKLGINLHKLLIQLIPIKELLINSERLESVNNSFRI